MLKCYISEGSAPAAGPSGHQLTADLQIGRISRISKICKIESIGNCAIRNIFPSRFDWFCFSNCQLVSVGLRSDLLILRGLGGPFFEHFGVLGHHFNTILMTIGCKGSLRRDLECSRMEFGWFVMDLGSPIGGHSGSLFDILFDLKCPKSHLDRRHPLWWFLNWKSCDLWCPHLSKV